MCTHWRFGDFPRARGHEYLVRMHKLLRKGNNEEEETRITLYLGSFEIYSGRLIPSAS